MINAMYEPVPLVFHEIKPFYDDPYNSSKEDFLSTRDV